MRIDSKNGIYKRFAVMGGTFDPIHYGHLVTAEAVRDKFKLDKVLFMPTKNPPHKMHRPASDVNHRYLMTVLATITNPYFEVSRLEIERSGMTYTVDTIRALRSIHGDDAEIYFITGADAILEILTWHNVEELLGICRFVAATRPGFYRKDMEQKLMEIKSKYDKEIFSIEVPSLAISSTDIRDRILNNKTIRYLLPEAVEHYIRKSRLYSK
ncbi:nicotinate-nucleotide adenylyltransferase [Lutispora sp.]|uniref:nicotinate-nucleotide adenylyltransferase n=1 Tax=Lutispora sp. TaxID=2828727 RepID=UPI000EBAC233|nr:nicotinate-nucleotide adenylyltransferase [Lutispora sp.]MEA4963121.1 nicotinate-nucleotide adenylyltransferase [Lutispora sp.]HCJ58238.1 nicotinic acid mononucleotide adenylyltransferase [Clostridiaceae bacterium]